MSVYMQHFPLWQALMGGEVNELSDSLQGGRQKQKTGLQICKGI